MEPRNPLEIAKAAIKAGDIETFTNVLSATYEESYIEWVNDTNASDSYAPMIKEERHRTKKVIDLNEHGANLLFLAAQTSRNEMIAHLIEMGVAVTPTIMKKYLDLLTVELLPSLRKIAKQSGIPAELEKHIAQSHAMTLIMFKAFLDYHLFHNPDKHILNGTDKAILNIFKHIEKYLPSESNEYANFMQYSKSMIILYGSAKVIKALDEKFHYSTDMEYLDEAAKWLKNNGSAFDNVIKLKFIHQLLSAKDPESLKEIVAKYNPLILGAIQSIQKLNKEEIARNSSMWTTHSYSKIIAILLHDIKVIGGDKNKSSVQKVWEMANLIGNTYNEICDEVNKTRTKKMPATVESLLNTLKVLTKNVHNYNQIIFWHFEGAKNEAKKVKLTQTDEMIADEFIAKRFAAPENKPSLKK